MKAKETLDKLEKEFGKNENERCVFRNSVSHINKKMVDCMERKIEKIEFQLQQTKNLELKDIEQNDFAKQDTTKEYSLKSFMQNDDINSNNTNSNDTNDNDANSKDANNTYHHTQVFDNDDTGNNTSIFDHLH